MESFVNYKNMKPALKIYQSPDYVAEALVEEFGRFVREKSATHSRINIALSGGNGPIPFFKHLASYNQIHPYPVNWEKIHFFWVDERCVPADDKDSNFGMTRKCLLKPLHLPETNIHRIRGEADPAEEAKRYAGELESGLPLQNGYPAFDWIFLGMGEDGHTASIFPDQMNLLYAKESCAVAIHPQTGQKRITLTGNVLLNASRVTFLVTGETKKQRIYEIIHEMPDARLYPANFIKPIRGVCDWYLDKQAAQLL